MDQAPPARALPRGAGRWAKPVWVCLCSCDEPTGLVTVARWEPKPNLPRLGHDGHTTRMVKLADDDRELDAEGMVLLRRALAVI